MTANCCPAFDYDMLMWGWTSDPDPSFILSILTSDEIPTGMSETCYSNPEYDRLYAEQTVEPDDAKRIEMVHEMQQIMLDDLPYIIPYYQMEVQAFRNDRFTDWPVPAEGSNSILYLQDPVSLTVVLPGAVGLPEADRVGRGGAKPPLPHGVGMARRDYLLKRAAWSLLTVLFVLVLNFFLFRILPGDPTTSIAKDPRLTAETRASLARRFGLDKPLILNFQGGNPFDSQFFAYFDRLAHGDLGTSFNFNRPVSELLGERIGNTVLLVMGGQVLAIVLGVSLGLLAAWKNRTAS